MVRIALAASLVLLAGCDGVRAVLVDTVAPTYAAEPGQAEVDGTLTPTFDGPDASRPQLPLRLVPVATGLSQPTDLQFVPGHPTWLVVLEKGGQAKIVDLTAGSVRGTLFGLDVLTRSEQGLLGLAFHPDFATNHKLYVNHVVDDNGTDATRVVELTVDPATWTAGSPRQVLQVTQPYANHNAGQVAFGPDGFLYVGLGDGGWRDDPKGHGQNATTLLGSMLRIDVNSTAGGKPYGVPSDNPFLDDPTVPPESWAVGLRNPWRYAFAPDGRLVVADVGQNTWEEVDVVGKGDNLGWNQREGRSCFPPDRDCASPEQAGLQDPFYVYDHQEGASITGGFVYTGSAIPALKGRYVFGDFVSGRLWAVDLPAAPQPLQPPLAAPTALGRYPLLLVTFGQGPDGELYAADYGEGVVYRLAPGA